jgi:hypothetical protein
LRDKRERHTSLFPPLKPDALRQYHARCAISDGELGECAFSGWVVDVLLPTRERDLHARSRIPFAPSTRADCNGNHREYSRSKGHGIIRGKHGRLRVSGRSGDSGAGAMEGALI